MTAQWTLCTATVDIHIFYKPIHLLKNCTEKTSHTKITHKNWSMLLDHKVNQSHIYCQANIKQEWISNTIVHHNQSGTYCWGTCCRSSWSATRWVSFRCCTCTTATWSYKWTRRLKVTCLWWQNTVIVVITPALYTSSITHTQWHIASSVAFVKQNIVV